MNKVKKILALSLALVMMLSVASFANVADFTDQADIPEGNLEAVKLLTALTVFNGYDDGSFRPGETITRAQAAKMIYVIANQGIDDGAEIYKGQNLFVDVAAGSWYEGYVNYCANVGIIAGRGNKVYDPEGKVTGYELMKMLLVVAEYKPAIQGYTGGSWAASVLRDATSAGMTKDYNFNMNTAAPRHWAARLFYNTLMNVQAAVYIGDTLFTNSGILGNASATVGEKRLGLQYEEAVVVGTKTAKLDGGAGEYDYSTVVIKGRNTEFDYDIANELLGQAVRVVYKLKNSNLTATTRNTQVFGVYATGTSLVYDVTVNDLTVKTKDTGVTVKFTGYNGGSAKTYLGNNFDTLVNNVFDNETKAKDLTAETLKNYFSRNSGDAVRFVDTDGDGYIDYAFVTETKYYKVNNITPTRATFSGRDSLNLKVADINFIDEVEKDDIVAVTVNYATGEEVYDVRKIEGTEFAGDKKYTVDGTGITSVTLDGTAYKLNAAAVDTALKNDDQVYFLDKGTVVYSKDAVGTSTLPTNLAIVTGMSNALIDLFDSNNNKIGEGFRVTYMGADAKPVSKNYDADTARTKDNAFGNGITEANIGDLRDEIEDDVFEDGAIVRVVTTDDGVYFTKYFSGTNGTAASGLTVGLNNGTDAEAKYEPAANTFAAGLDSLDTDASTYFFVRHSLKNGDYKYTVKKATELNKFNGRVELDAQDDPIANSYDKVTAYVKDKSAAVKVAYLDMGAKGLPSASADKYAVITGNPSAQAEGNDTYLLVNAIVASGETETFKVKLDAGVLDGKTNATDATAEMKLYRWRMVKYTVDSKGVYTVEPISVVGANKGDVSAYSSTSVVVNNSRYQITEDTVIFYYYDESVSIYSSPVTTGANAAYVIAGETSGLQTEAAVLLINGEDKDVVVNNVAKKVDASTPAGPGSNPIKKLNFVGLPVTAKTTFTFGGDNLLDEVESTTTTITVLFRVGTGAFADVTAIGDGNTVKVTPVTETISSKDYITGFDLEDMPAGTYDFKVITNNYTGDSNIITVVVK